MAYYGDQGHLHYLASQLSKISLDSDVQQTRKLMQMVTRLCGKGADTSLLFAQVSKLLASSDLLVKKMVCWYIQQYATNQELQLLTVNQLLKDCRDANPVIRALGLRTLASLQADHMVEHCTQAVTVGLKDQSAYVRRAAVCACAKLGSWKRECVVTSGLVDQLYRMIRDTDPIVVTNSLSALEELLAEEGGTVLNKNMVHFILNKLHTFTDMGLYVIFQLLFKYKPKSDQETIDIMNVIDDYLKHNNCCIVTSVIQFLLKLTQHMPQLHSEVFRRAHVYLFKCLTVSNHEMSSQLLDFLEGLMDDHKAEFEANLKVFYCKHSEPVHLKLKKMRLLPRLVCEENAKEIVDELFISCKDSEKLVSSEAIMLLGKIALKAEDILDACTVKFIELLNLKIGYITSSVLKVLLNIDLTGTEYLKNFVKLLPSCMHLVSDTSGQMALVSLTAQYGDLIPDAPYIMEELVEGLGEAGPDDSELLLAMLSSATRLFLKRPAECQDMLAMLYDLCTQCEDVHVHDHLLFYYDLLRGNPTEACKVLNQTP